jgi:hypothetical protein
VFDVLKEVCCRKCGAVFKFNYSGKGGLKYLCDPCRKENRREREQVRCSRRRRGSVPHGNENAVKAVELNSNADVAQFLGISSKHVERLVRSALAKLQKNSELRELWRACLEEGLPAQEDWGDRLLDYQLELNRFYGIYDQLRGRNCEAEALECLAEIRKFQHALGKVLGLNREEL